MCGMGIGNSRSPAPFHSLRSFFVWIFRRSIHLLFRLLRSFVISIYYDENLFLKDDDTYVFIETKNADDIIKTMFHMSLYYYDDKCLYIISTMFYMCL